MKRLRLRKIWVVLAVFMLLVPLLSGRMEKSEATSTTTATTAGGSNPSSGYTINFMVAERDQSGNIIGSIPDDGTSMPQFDLTPPAGSGNGFQSANPANITAQIMLNGQPATNLSANYDIKWEAYVNGNDVTSGVRTDVMDVNPTNGSTNVDYICDIQPKSAGLLNLQFKVTLTEKNAASGSTPMKFYITRNALITVPLQLYYAVQDQVAGGTSYFKYATTEMTQTINILANNADSSKIEWYYLDLTTDEYIKLENPLTFERNDPKSNSYLISSIGSPVDATIQGSYPYSVHKYAATVAGFGGISRLVARIYLNNTSTEEYYIEKTFDVLIKAKEKTVNKTIELAYGETKRFQDISNDHGDSLEWYEGVNGWDKQTVASGVVALQKGVGIIGKNWGTTTLYLTPVPAYRNWEFFNQINNLVNDSITVKTGFAILKGEVESERVKADSYEVVDMNGKITLSTNVTAKSGYTYAWEYESGGQRIDITSSAAGDKNPYLEYVNGASTAGGGKSTIVLKGVKPGIVNLICTVTAEGETLTETITIKVVDSITLSESRKTIPVGSSFVLNAYSNTTGTITWTSSNENYVTVDPTGTEVTVTGVGVSGNEWVTITATQASSGRIATCQVRVIEAVSTVTIEGDTVLAKDAEGKLELVFSGKDPGYTKDEIKWVLKDKNGIAADTILTLEVSEANVKKATIKGLTVGELYVAVVTNDSVQTEIAVTTVKVVSSPDGLEIDAGEEIIDYLTNATYTLHATVLPKGYVDENLEISWTSNNETIATVAVDPNDSKTAVVTYHAVGKVRVTAVVQGIPLATDFCDFYIQNPATDVELNPSGEHRMKVGETVQMTATVIPDNVTDASVTWESSDEAIVTVDKNGLVTAVAAGSATITATTSNGIRRSCIIIVLTPADGIELNYTTITVKKGTIFYLSAKVTPDSAYDKSVTFTSADNTIATVEQDGTVTALKVGSVDITVTSNDNPEISAVCTVIVTEAVAGLTLNAREITIDVGEQYLLKATVKPSDAENTAVTFETADASIATVDESGLITGVKGGVTVVFVKTVERGLIASCTVTVQEDITSITMAETETYIGKGKDKQLKVTIQPASATQKKLQWKSSNESIVIVDQDGNIHGVNLGTAIITATARDDGKVFATCKVTVVEEVTKITLNQSIIRLMQNDTYQLTYAVEPATATVKKVSWSTSDASVARVDSLGLVTAVGQGEAKIRVTAADNSGTYAECTVIVTPLVPVTSLQVNTTATTMLIGDTRTLTARANPRNTTEGIRWVSSDTSIAKVNNNGYVEAVGAGVCQITAISSVSGVESTSTVTVLGLNATDITLEQYDSFDLYLDGVEQNVTWFSRNKRIATVSKKGVVTARKEGTTDIVARVNGKLVACQITVEKMKK